MFHITYRLCFIIVLLATLQAVLVKSLSAQERDRLGAGARIRLWSEQILERERIGRLMLLDQDSITLNVTGDSALSIITLPLESVGRLDMSIGRNPAALAAVIALGAALGAVAVPALTSDPAVCDLGYEDSPACTTEVSDVVIGMAAGAILGTVTAQIVIKERWLSVRMDVLMKDGTVDFHNELRVSVSLHF